MLQTLISCIIAVLRHGPLSCAGFSATIQGTVAHSQIIITKQDRTVNVMAVQDRYCDSDQSRVYPISSQPFQQQITSLKEENKAALIHIPSGTLQRTSVQWKPLFMQRYNLSFEPRYDAYGMPRSLRLNQLPLSTSVNK